MSSHLNYEFGSLISGHQLSDGIDDSPTPRHIRARVDQFLPVPADEVCYPYFLYPLDDSLVDAVINADRPGNSSAAIRENLCQSVSHLC